MRSPSARLLVAACLGASSSVVLAQAAAGPAPNTAAPQGPPSGFARPAAHVNAPLGNIPSHPGDGDGAYKTGRYRDLFAEAGHPAAETDARIEKDFQQFFHGDATNERVYFEAGSNANGPLAYITDWANNDARTEGMSYGMMIAVQLNHKHEFDAIWNWSNTYMLVTDPANPNVGYFAWSMNTDGTPRSTGPAPDGEEYYAMALLFAAHRWGNGQGIYNYQEQANRILRGMVHREVKTGTGPFKIHPDDKPFTNAGPLQSPNNYERQQGQADLAIELKGEGKDPNQANGGFRRFGGGAGFGGGNFTPRPSSAGPMMDVEHFMVKFTPDTGPNNSTDASYHLPGFYELFARWGPKEDHDFWIKAADVSRDMFPKVVGANTGLSPDRNNFDETEIAGRDGQPTPFGYDSWRTVSNWSFDYSWFHKAPSETVLSDRVQKFLVGQGISTFADRYTLDGKPLSTRHSVGMVAAAAVGSLAATRGPNEKAFVEELWRTPMPVGEQRYFDGMLYMMSMLHASGNFRIWMPK
ncbi:MAG TPA: glycosyl hydrolase family 8 [Acidobacteriaceae bacterium]|nr:glycosyl hydrolase family 8 [Acidobacteriaceae bacterium]